MSENKKLSLSVVVITKNEEKRIRECLESVKWASEIVVLDDYSQDKTLDIVREYTDKVYQQKMTNEGAHRNHSYSLAENEWVLSLDADERVTPELAEEISVILKQGTDCNGFLIPRKNFIGDYWIKYGGWYPSAQLKFFKRDRFKWEEVDVHPRAYMKDPRGYLENPLVHYSYKDLEDFVSKLDNQTSRESDKWLDLEKGMPFTRAMRRSIDRYARAYYRKGGKKDGMYGFILAALGGFYQFLSYAKYWEKKLNFDYVESVKANTNSAKGGISEKINDINRKKLSVVIIAKNEEDKIRNCLESLKWVDEVVVVDGFSTDKTVEICKEYGVNVVQHKFEGDFGLERNIGIDNSSGDWILQLDADEMVTEGFRNAMIEVLKTEDKFVAYKFLRKNYFLGRFMKYGGWYHHSHHLFRKGFARYQGRVHHQLIVDGKIGVLNEDIEHYPFQSFSQLITRQNRYTTIEAKEMLELRPKIDEKEIRYNIKVKPRKLFWKFFIKKKGFKEGMHGFLFSVLFAWVHFLKWAKYWELVEDQK